MKSYPFLLLLACAVLVPDTEAQRIVNVGVLGNSGEQGETLVRFGKETRSGLGAVYDDTGTLWDRGGNGTLNRYAPDGRLLGSWALPVSTESHLRDGLVRLDDKLLIKQNRKLYTFPLNAGKDAVPTVLPVEATLLAFNTHEGWAAAAFEKKVFWINLAGETRDIATLEDGVWSLEVGPNGSVYATVIQEGKSVVLRLDASASVSEKGPWPSPGNRFQWLNGYWYGHADHGTIRRFDKEFKPVPGVVLGGNSGWFIGYVPGNYELENGNGLAHLHGNVYAVSGRSGVLHLLEWKGENLRFDIIRRIGSVPDCKALGLDDEGRVWYHSGMWEWTDAPDTPLKHGVPTPDAPGAMGGLVDEQGRFLVAAHQHNKGMLYTGSLDGPLNRHSVTDLIPKDGVATALLQVNNKRSALVVNQQGKGNSVSVTDDYKAADKTSKPAQLQSVQPLNALTSLSSKGDTLVAAADGAIILFDSSLKESKRWNSWDGDSFGSQIFASVSKNQLWVADSEKHRVLCFDISNDTPRLLATFGSSQTAGAGMDQLHSPQRITANQHRAVVHDSGNQRLIRLELQ